MHDLQVLLSQISESKFFNKINVTKVNYLLDLNKQSRPYTAFQTHGNTYEFNFLPFGLCNSPATFVRLMRGIFRNVQNVVHYFDDIGEHTKSFDEYIPEMRDVLEVLKSNGLTAKPVKTEVARNFTSIFGSYHGHLEIDLELTGATVIPSKRVTSAGTKTTCLKY